MRRIRNAVLMVLVSLFALASFAQMATTSLRGIVKDSSGAVLPGATITLSAKATGQVYTEHSKANGEYQFAQIPPAQYTIKVAAAGFADQSKSAELLVDNPASVNFAMAVKGNTEVVDVSVAAQTLNTTDATLGDAKDNALIQALPSETRNVADLLSLEPGVLSLPTTANGTTDPRSGAVNGGRSDQGNVTLDGVDDNDQVNGYAFTGVLRVTQDATEEFRVTTADANADEGRSSGAQTSLITKSGTNKFHGAAYEYNRPTNTVSNDYFNKQGQLQSGYANRPPKLIRNIFGADLGGPIFKDKLFFFGNYEGLRQAESQIVSQITPTASYQQGYLSYPGGPTGGITPAQMTQLDAGCTVCNTADYSPGPGANPFALKYFNSMPTANGTLLGDGGFNTGSFTFSSPRPVSQNTSIVKLDYTPNDKQRLFVRGNLQKDTVGTTEQFPGQGPSSRIIDNTKGIAFGDTWTISPSLVNDLRYGYIRQGTGVSGVGVGDYVDFRFLSTATAETRNAITSVPVNNIVDNLNWTKGKHNIQAGVNWRLVHQNRTSDANSHNFASSNPSWLGGSAPTPDTIGLPAVPNAFSISYNEAYANLVGTVPEVTDITNYKVTSPTTGTLLGDGVPLARHFIANEYEAYLQDSWRAKANLTLTFGLRYSLLQTPYESTGQQLTPTLDTHAFSAQREIAALKGQIYEPDIQFAPAGKSYGKPGFYPEAKNNIAPRFAIVYSPDSKTSIRAGFGLYYDHFGEGLVNTFDQNGEFGLASQSVNQPSVQRYETSPRFTGSHNFPAALATNGSVPATQTFPYTAPLGSTPAGFAISWGIDNHLKTPYNENFDFSVQRELGHGFTLETAYVGRLGRHLLQSLDLTQPVDYVDPQGGGDYYTAGAQLFAEVDQNGGGPGTVAPIKYFEDVFGYAAGTDAPGESATQAIYNNEAQPGRTVLGATEMIADLDFFCGSAFTGNGYACPSDHTSRFWQDQFASLYALSTIGQSSYNALQISLRHPSSHGLQLQFNYTLAKSLDWGSDAERNTYETNANPVAAASEIQNTWKPYLNRGPSDFDVRHAITVDYVYQLPFGAGKAFLGNANTLVNALIGGWQTSGIVRATSGLPFSLNAPGWDTDWQITSRAVNVGNIKAQKHIAPGGNPLYFDSAAALNAGVSTGTPIRLPYPGEAGQRNNFRGDGYFGIDSGVSKAWGLSEFGLLRFTWEVYNVTNSNRFDPFSISGRLTDGSLGTASALLTQPRRMQFSLRYEY